MLIHATRRELSAAANLSILVVMVGDIETLDKIRGENLRRLRKQRGWSQGELAEKTGIEQSKISAYENGLGFNKETLVRFCKAFQVKPWEFDWEESTPIIKDTQELEDIRRRREAERIGIADMVREAEASWITAAKKKEGAGSEGTKSGTARRTRKRAG